MGRRADITRRSHPRQVLTTCSMSLQQKAKRRITCHQGKGHLYLLHQKSVSRSQVLHRELQARTKGRKKMLGSLEMRKKADLWCSLHGSENPCRGSIEVGRSLAFELLHSIRHRHRHPV